MLVDRCCQTLAGISEVASVSNRKHLDAVTACGALWSKNNRQRRHTTCSQRTHRASEPVREPLSASKRCLLLALAAVPLAAPRVLHAQELWSLAETSKRLPPGYEEFAGKLAAALREAIETDLSDAEERQVRKKADPAKNLVKGWLSDWKDAPGVQAEPSYTQLSGTIRELGEFYRKKGQRARLPRTFGEELLAKLAAAENSLPVASSADGKQRV
ncbi:probable photosystem II D1 precursor processing protein PSB27-H2, chloroplastic at C-terminar half [Coccomyxa sp. Obi]|nr:probable photosystem II D1 precursor processing protein PSB27-H2, chloroplastic at C-terminar half [Coccomyxa sp. Obi]